MAINDGVRRYLDAGISLRNITRARAEEIVRELVNTGEVERSRAQDWVEDLVNRSRETSEVFVSTVRNEIRRQLADLGITDIDQIARAVAEIIGDLPDAARSAARTGATRAKSTGRRVKKAVSYTHLTLPTNREV